MKSQSQRGSRAIWVRTTAFLVLGMLVAGHAAAQVTAEPAQLVFRSYDQVETVRLNVAGQPVPVANIRSHAVHVGDRIFNEFFTIEKADGQVTISPTQAVEIGRYQIFVHTRQGSAVVEVYTPLDQAPDSLETRARERGITVEELRREMGLVTPTGREIVRIELPPTYYQGQTVRIAMEQKPGRIYTWRVNGEVVAQGPDAHTLEYTFTRPGEHQLQYTEQLAETGGTIASTTVSTNVVAETALLTPVSTISPVTLSAPGGYRTYVWRLDDQVVGQEATLVHRFRAPGEYVIICEARDPLQDGLVAVRQVPYRVVVTVPGA